MTRATFGVAASSLAASCFAANMAVKQNAIDHEAQFTLAARSVKKAFYVDDALTEAAGDSSYSTCQHGSRVNHGQCVSVDRRYCYS